MKFNKKLFLFAVFTCIYSATYSQIEVAQLQSKGISATGFGAFINVSVPITQNDAIIAGEARFIILSTPTTILPLHLYSPGTGTF